MQKYTKISPSPLHRRVDPRDTPGSWLPTWNNAGRKNERPGTHAANTVMPSSTDGPFVLKLSLLLPEAFAAPQSQPPDINWVMKIISDRSLPEQKTLVPECPKNQQASLHCQWRWSRRSCWALILLPQCICKVHRCPHNLPVCFGHTLSKEGKKQGKSAQKLLLHFGKLKEITVCKLGVSCRNLQGRIWVFVWQGKVLQKVSAA